MSEYTYEILEHWNNDKTILRSDGTHIPMVAGNADYEAYLNPDKMEHLTEIPTPDEA